MKKLYKTLGLITTAILLASCTNQEIYSAIQENRQRECQKLPESLHEECIENHSETYESYQRTREEVLSSNSG